MWPINKRLSLFITLTSVRIKGQDIPTKHLLLPPNSAQKGTRPTHNLTFTPVLGRYCVHVYENSSVLCGRGISTFLQAFCLGLQNISQFKPIHSSLLLRPQTDCTHQRQLIAPFKFRVTLSIKLLEIHGSILTILNRKKQEVQNIKHFMKTKLLISQGVRINVAEHDSRITIALSPVHEICYMYMVLKHTQ